MRWLLGPKTDKEDCSLDDLKAAVQAGGEPFWLDIQDPSDEDLAALQSVLQVHGLSIDDIRKGGQRPKWEQYPGYVFMVLVTPTWEGQVLSVHEQYLCLSERWTVTVHRGPSPWLEGLRQRAAADPQLLDGGTDVIVYRVTGAIVDAAFSGLDAIDDAVDNLEDRLESSASATELGEITQLRHAVTDLRRELGAQRDCFELLVSEGVTPGQGEAALYYRDVYDHLTRQYETVDSLRDLLSGAMDVYLSTVSNRLNGTMKTLTVVGSIFLPLSFLTGFFGMNFAYETGVVQSSAVFFYGAIGLMGVSIVAQLVLFRVRHWI